MKRIFYEKVGRRYVPVAEYDSDLIDSFPKGHHLVVCQPGISSRRYSVDPDYASLVAAAYHAKESIVKAISAKSQLELLDKDGKKKMLTEEQRIAWENLISVMGDDARKLTYASANDVAEAGVEALINEAKKLLNTPSVRLAWEEFMMIAKMSEDSKND